MAAILVGLTAFGVYGAAMVMMKYGAEMLARPRSMFAGASNRRKSLVWLAGCVANVTYVVLFSVALGLGHASVIAALNGFGLVVAAVLSRLFLREAISRAEALGIGLIVLGTAGVGYWGTHEPTCFAFSFKAFLVYNLVLGALNLAGSLAVIIAGYRGAAFVFAAVGGCLGGVSALFQKIFMTPLMTDGPSLGEAVPLLIRNPYFLVFLVTSMAAFVMLQVAYQFGTAVQVVPTFSAAIILSPFWGGILAFQEPFGVPQGLSVAVILTGVYFLAGRRKRSAGPPSTGGEGDDA